MVKYLARHRSRLYHDIVLVHCLDAGLNRQAGLVAPPRLLGRAADEPPRRFWRAGNFNSPMNGETHRVFRVTFAGSPGALTSLVQVFSGLNLRVEQLEYATDPSQSDRASVVVRYLADAEPLTWSSGNSCV